MAAGGATRFRPEADKSFAGQPAIVRGMARPSLRSLFRNFDDYDAPLDRKIAKALRNNAKKALTLSTCCGHPGEPGC